jgi:hypothetical protein
MFWIIGIIIIYFIIGLGLSWLLNMSGGEKFKLNKQAISFILKWPIYIIFNDQSE